MAEILGSAVASESVSKIFSILSGNPREPGSAEDNAERLEFAVLKIHSVVAISEDWQVLHQPLLNWKARLKCLAKEGDAMLRAYKMRSSRNKSTSVGKRVTGAAKRFLPFRRGVADDNDPNDAAVRRFERLANSADEFFRYVQLGGRPKSLLVACFRIPTQELLAGRTLEVSMRKGTEEALLLLHPCEMVEAGGPKEIVLFLSCDDTTGTAWEKNVKLSVVFQLTEHATDILGIVMSSLELLPPQFGAACVTIRELARNMLTQDSPCRNASAMSVWSGATAWKCHRYSTDKGFLNGNTQLPFPIIRVAILSFALPQNDSSDRAADHGMPLKLMGHVAPGLVPERYSHQYQLIEVETLQKLLPAVTDQGAVACKGDWWCPRSSTYLSVVPELSMPPPTLKQLYLMENSEGAV